MDRMLTPEPSLPGAATGALGETASAESGDYEWVLGKRQMAGLGLVVLAVVGTAAGGAYIAGKAAGRTVEKIVRVERPAAMPAAPAAPASEETPLFGRMEPGKVYVQLASVERGYAQLMARGVRQAGYPALVAEGMNANVFRVLAGPFATAEEAARVKAVFDGMGLNAFLRKYEPPAAAGPAGAAAP
jgi:hypothetical protein